MIVCSGAHLFESQPAMEARMQVRARARDAVGAGASRGKSGCRRRRSGRAALHAQLQAKAGTKGAAWTADQVGSTRR